MAAEKKKKRVKKSTRDPKFHWPLVEDRCVKEILPKGKFHPASFRNKVMSTKKAPKGKSFLMIGCPKFVKGRGMKKAHETRWITTPHAIATKNQCIYADGPRRGEKAGTRAHVVIEAKGKSGKCRAGYEKAEKKAKR